MQKVLEQAHAAVRTLQNEISTLTESEKSWKDLAEQRLVEMGELETQVLEAAEQNETLESGVQSLHDELTVVKEEARGYREEANRYNEQASRVQQEREQLEDELNRIREELNQLQESYTQIRSDYGDALQREENHTRKLAELDQEKQALEQAIATSGEHAAKLTEQISEQRNLLAQTEEEALEWQIKHEELSAKQAELISQLDELKERETRLLSRVEQAEQQDQVWQRRADEWAVQEQSWQERWNQLENELNAWQKESAASVEKVEALEQEREQLDKLRNEAIEETNDGK